MYFGLPGPLLLAWAFSVAVDPVWGRGRRGGKALEKSKTKGRSNAIQSLACGRCRVLRPFPARLGADRVHHHEGEPIALDDPRYSDADSDSLVINALTPDTAGFYSCIVSNICGRVVSDSALVRITGDEGGGGGPDNCRSDFNDDGSLDPDDLSDFIGGYFATEQNPRDDWNDDGAIDPDDLSDYISDYFSGCR